MDRDLKRQGLLRNRIKETLSFDEDAAIAFSTHEKPYEVPRPQGVRRAFPIASSLERFGARPKDLKHSHLIDLFQRDHFDGELNEQLKRVAYFILKDLTDPDWVSLLAPDLTESQFHRLQAQVHREVERSLPCYAREFITYWSLLTASQREAITLYYFENDVRRSKKEIAGKLGISVDALKDRLEGALRKLEAHFLPLIPSRERRPSYWKTLHLAPDTRERGMFVKSNAEKRHPVYRLDIVTKSKISEITSYPPLQTRTPQTGWSAWKAWERVTTHWPRYNGTASPLLAHLPNAYLHDQHAGLAKGPRTHVKFITADAKTAFDQLLKDRLKKSKRKTGKVLFDREWLEQNAIDDREEDDLDMNAEPE